MVLYDYAHIVEDKTTGEFYLYIREDLLTACEFAYGGVSGSTTGSRIVIHGETLCFAWGVDQKDTEYRRKYIGDYLEKPEYFRGLVALIRHIGALLSIPAPKNPVSESLVIVV